MKKWIKWGFIILIMTFIIFLWWLWRNSSIGTEVDDALIVSVTSFFGGADIITIYKNGTFRNENDRPFNTGSICLEGSVSESDYTFFVSYLRSTNIIDSKIKQRDEGGLICEGGTGLIVTIDGKTNDISLPCVVESTAETAEIVGLMAEVRGKLKELIDKSPQNSCPIK